MYGIKKDLKGLLPWSHVQDRMKAAMHYWICSVGPSSRPHATPVDGVWLDDTLYFGGSPETRWRRNLSANSAINVHLESTTDVVILRGDIRPLGNATPSFKKELAKASKEKYGFAPPPEQFGNDVCVFRPTVVLAWNNFATDATRWEFPTPV
jgi:hypothetical protein